MTHANNEVYKYEGCTELSINNSGTTVHQPDRLALYTLCKLVHLTDSAKNIKINKKKSQKHWESYKIRNIKLIHSTIALWLKGNDWSTGIPRPYKLWHHANQSFSLLRVFKLLNLKVKNWTLIYVSSLNNIELFLNYPIVVVTDYGCFMCCCWRLWDSYLIISDRGHYTDSSPKPGSNFFAFLFFPFLRVPLVV